MTLRLLIALAALGLALPSAADIQPPRPYSGRLASPDPVYTRPYLYLGSCYLSSTGTSVFYDVHELVLQGEPGSIQLTADTCTYYAAFDSVLYLYQRYDGLPGAFQATAPCENLVVYDDDFCGPQSRVFEDALWPGHVDVVITTFANGQGGSYRLNVKSVPGSIEGLIFYAGFEQGDARPWSAIEP